MPDDEQNRFGRSLGEGYSYVALGFTFAVAILAFGALGWVVDGWLGTRPWFALLLLGLGLVVVVVRLGGRDGAIGGAVAVAAQFAAVALLRPAMRAPQPVFMARWLGGMGVRALALGVLLVFAVTERSALAPLTASLGFLGVLLPLLFVETEFLK